VLESVKRPQVLPQDVSTSHDFLGQDTQVFQAHEKEGSSRVYTLIVIYNRASQDCRERESGTSY
jgi:hypothetical protein